LFVEPLPSSAIRAAQLSDPSSAPVKKDNSARLVIANQDEDEGGEWASENMKAEDVENEAWHQAKNLFNEITAFRPTLESPPPSKVSFDEFFKHGRQNEFLHVGREKVEESKIKSYKATIWMYMGDSKDDSSKSTGSLTNSVLGWVTGSSSFSEDHSNPDKTKSSTLPIPLQSPDFPIKISQIIPLLDLIGLGSNQHIRSLREFLMVQLPSGFPVKIEIPLYMLSLSASVTFQNLNMSPNIDDDIFTIPGKKEQYRAGEVIKSQNDE
jgi:hypothetical protein